MSDSEILLSEKYLDFMDHIAPVEFLEGTTYAGKTTVGVVKFFLRVAESPKKMHILSGLDLGTIEKNIIQADLGVSDVFGGRVDYRSNGSRDHKLPHILFDCGGPEPKVIYVLGYDNKTRWKKALGGQYGCLYIDEINIADMEYVREASMRCDYLMGTLNPDDPHLEVYSEYINCARPLAKWSHETPREILEQLTSEQKPGWTHWFFSFKDNLALTEEKLEQIVTNVPVGTKLYKNKIQGLRGRATGLVFPNFSREKHVLSRAALLKWMDTNGLLWSFFSCGVDTAYSDKSPDVIAMEFQGITTGGHLVVLAEEIYNNQSITEPLAPSDVVLRLVDFLARQRKQWGFAKDVFIDSADAASIKELQKHWRNVGSIHNFIPAYKKMTVIDRIHLQVGWIAQGYYLVLDECPFHIRELESYSWKDDKYEPEDRNDHSINASQYGFIPYTLRIGVDNTGRVAAVAGG